MNLFRALTVLLALLFAQPAFAQIVPGGGGGAVSSVAGKTGAVTLVAPTDIGNFNTAAAAAAPVTSVNGATGAVTVASGPPNVYNWNPGVQLRHWHMCKAKALQSAAQFAAAIPGTTSTRCKITFSGDSTTAGVGATNGSANYKLSSWPNSTAAAFIQAGYNAHFANFQGNSGDTNADTRITLVAGGTFSGAAAFGGNLVSGSAVGDGVSFNSGSSLTFDRVEVCYFATGAPYSVTIGAQTAITVTTSNTGAMTCTTTNAATPFVGTTAVKVLMTATSPQLFIQDINLYSSTVPAIELLNGGVGGTTANGCVGTSGYGCLQGNVALTPHLCIWGFGINDANTYNTSGASLAASATTFVQQCQAAGADVVLYLEQPWQNSNTNTYWAQYLSALQGVATALNVPLLDIDHHYNDDYTYLSAQGLYYGGLHPNGILYKDMAYYIANLLAGA